MIRTHLLSICLVAISLAYNVQAMDPMDTRPDETYEHLLNRVIQSNNDLDLRESAAMIKLDLHESARIVKQVHDWALTHKPQQLEKAYESLVDGFRYYILYENPTDRDAAYDSLCNILDQYAVVNHEKAMIQLEFFINHRVLEGSFSCHFSQLPTYPIKLLKLLKKMDAAIFESVVQKVVEKKLTSFLRLALAHPEHMKMLKDKRLSVEGLIKTALDNVCAHPDKSDNLEHIIFYGTSYHTRFEHEIAQLLPAVLKQSYIEHDILKLFQSPSAYLRKNALSTLLGYISDGGNSVEAVYRKKDIIKNIFKHEKNAPLQAVELYKRLFAVFKNASSTISDFGIQLLIQRCIQQPAYETLGHSLLAQYFNISVERISHHQPINTAFGYAMQANTVPLVQFNNILVAGQETGFERYIDHDVVQKLKMKMLQEEKIPLKNRVQFLNELLFERLNSKKDYTDLKKLIDTLPFSPFVRYARAFCIALNPKFNQSARFAARADLVQLAKQYPGDFPEDQKLLRTYCEPLFEAFDTRKTDKHHIHVKQSFGDPYFPNGPYCFGYVCNIKTSPWTYRLYACNKKTGLPVWVSPVVSKKKLPYAIFKNCMYSATESGRIVQLDLSNGTLLQEFKIEDNAKISKLYATDQAKLFVLYKNSTILVDLKTGKWYKIPLPKESNVFHVSFVNDKLVIPTTTDLFIVDSHGKTMQVPHYSCNYFPPHVSGTNQCMFYEKIDNNIRVCALVCLDANTGKQLWEYPIDSFVQTQISHNSDRVFVLTRREVMALATHPQLSKRLIWKANFKEDGLSEIDSIYLSNDSSVLYGLNTHSGELYQFDIKTGKQIVPFKKTLSGKKELVGDFNKKLYIQVISF